MPDWQSLTSITVVITMFNVVPALNALVQYVAYGEKKELGLCMNEFNYRMKKRDEAYQQLEARVRTSMEKMDATKE